MNIFNIRTNVHYNHVPTPSYHSLPVYQYPVYSHYSTPYPFYTIQNQYSSYPVYPSFSQFQYPINPIVDNSFFPGQYTSDQVDTSLFQDIDDVVVIDGYIPELNLNSDRGDEEHAQDHELLEEEQSYRREIVQGNLTTRIQQQNSDDDICVVCQEEYKAEEDIARMKCGHEYHNDCIQKWLFRKDTCPMCKANYY